ncbi:tetratricopeptide repeat protein [Microcoleus sp. BROC3]|uniref:tetratricopeptide repeat protein n=1 Tax=Microcoleus sp. BROC3 TaxID=3055323 RepID=UPI002FD10F7A
MQELKPADRVELTKLVNAVALSDRSLSLFAIAPDSAPNHPVVEQFKAQLQDLDEPFEFRTLLYSDDSLFDCLHRLDGEAASGRRVVMAFGLEYLPRPRLVQEMQQLNLGRERIFDRNIVLVFWLSRETFLNEFRQQAADFWDWRGNVAYFATRPPSNPLLYPYLQWLIAENSYLKIAGVMQVNRQVDILLDRIYVSLQAEWVEEQSQSFRERVTRGEGRVKLSHPNKLGEPDFPDFEFTDEPMLAVTAEASSRQRVTKIVDLAEGLRKHTYSAILGDPGAGKTTLLRYLARHFAIAYCGLQAKDEPTTQSSGEESPSPLRVGEGSPNLRVRGGMDEDLGEIRLPILFRIADFAERLAQQPDLSLVEYLKQFYRHWEGDRDRAKGDAVADLLLAKMAAGDCLVLMDGLDEVFDRANRVQVVQQIDRLVKDYGENKFVITSRIAGYQEASLGSRFRELTITPMGNAQIEQFLERWCFAIEEAQRPEADVSLNEREAQREARGIFQAIETKPGVNRFATNPLLLTILALIHRNGTQMPQRRVELYQLATKTLIEDWQFGRNISYGVQQRQLSLVEEEVTALLAPLAFQMHEEKPSGLVTQAEVEAWLTPKMAELQGVEEPEALELVRQFLRKVRETTGLFVERAPAVYGFMHLTFEEYYAARYIADNEIPDILKIINTYRYQARWNEPILLALGYLSADRQRVNRLLEQLFGNLADYQPDIAGKEMRLKEAGANRVLVWYPSAEAAPQESNSLWQDLLFVGQVLAEIKVTPKFCRQQVERLVVTYLGLDEDDFPNEPTQNLLRLLRGIEVFNQQVLDRLQQAAEDERLSQELQNKARVAMLYVVCGEAGEGLIAGVTSIVQQLTPSLFEGILNLVSKLGVEMTPALERGLEDAICDSDRRQALEFMTGLSYLRAENYDRAISLLHTLEERGDCDLGGFVEWAIAIACEKKEDYNRSLNYYQQCSDKLLSSRAADIFILWEYWGTCYRAHQKYDYSLNCFQEALGIARQSNNRKREADILWNIGRSYQSWEKYEEAIDYHQQSREIYEQVGKQINVANQWYWIGNCYQAQGKYKQAIEFLQLCLNLRQLEDDGRRVALSLSQLGRIYKDWSKYEEATAHYQQSRELYQQLGKEKDVANQWYNLADCYRQWGKYEQAIDAAQQDLALRQQLDDRPKIALAYEQLGRISRDWGKYEEAIVHRQQSRELYQQLGKKEDVAKSWFRMANCYWLWGKYEQALDAAQQDLALHQQLDDRPRTALAYEQLGGIYQDWGKYEEAIAHYQQSQKIYQQLGKEKEVTYSWYWMADCYRLWGKYEQALDAAQQNLALCQQLNDRPRIALAYYQLGRIYQDWGKYEEAIAHYQQSRELYQQLGKEKDVAKSWYWMALCYWLWGKYEQALDAAQQNLALRQQLDDLSNIADGYFQLGGIYQVWGKYEEAIAHHQQSRELYQQLGKEKNVANQWYWIADCYRQWGKYEGALDAAQQDLALRQQLDDRPNIAAAYYQLGRIYLDWGKYEEAIAHHQQSREIYQQLGKTDSLARQLRRIAHSQRQLARETPDRTAAISLLTQAEQHLEQAIQLNIDREYRENLAYDYIALSLVCSDFLRHIPAGDPAQAIRIAQFENTYPMGFSHLTALGQTVNLAEETLDIARAYLEIPALENLNLAESLTRQSLQTFEDFNRRRLQADALKLLGEIYKHRLPHQPDATATAAQFFLESRQLYQELDLTEKAIEIERYFLDDQYTQ